MGDPINMKDTLGLFLSPAGDWGDPCGIFGLLPIEDSWWNNAFDFSSIFCFTPILLPKPEPDPPTEPQQPICTIQVYDRLVEFLTDLLPFPIPIKGARHGYIVFTDRFGIPHYFEGIR